jgi:hypothetical protein
MESMSELYAEVKQGRDRVPRRTVLSWGHERGSEEGTLRLRTTVDKTKANSE